MVQYGPMTTLQAVMHRGARTLNADNNTASLIRYRDEPLVVNYLPNPDSRSPWQIAAEIPGASAPELASPDILRIAEYAREQDLRLTRFQLVDRRYLLLPEPAQSDISQALVEALNDGGTYRVRVILRRDFPNVFLNGVELYKYPGVRIEIRRGGVLLSNDSVRLEEFFSAAVEALGIS